MIWTPTPPTKKGTIRVVRRFAWLPVTLVNDDKLWLQRYYATEQWGVVTDGFVLSLAWVHVARTSRAPAISISPASPQTPPDGAA